MSIEKENKTSASQIKASVEYDKRKGNTTIACKVNKEYKSQIEKHYKEKGYKSFNEYIIALVKKDMNKQEYELCVEFVPVKENQEQKEVYYVSIGI